MFYNSIVGRVSLRSTQINAVNALGRILNQGGMCVAEYAYGILHDSAGVNLRIHSCVSAL